MKENIYDVIIVGAGPSGMTAAMYSSRSKLKTLIIESKIYGGQMMNTSDIENYTGVGKVTGEDLSERMFTDAMSFGAEIVFDEVIGVRTNQDSSIKHIKTALGEEYVTKTVILATGTINKTLGIPSEKEFLGRGVSYCALCDGAFFESKRLLVVGGGDSAIEEAIFLTDYADEVIVAHRRGELRANPAVQERAFGNNKIKFLWNSELVEIRGKENVKSVVMKNNLDNQEYVMDIDGVFIYVGLEPQTELLKEFSKMKDKQIVSTEEDLGFFATGDVLHGQVRQIATAVGSGVIAAQKAYNYLETNKC